MSDGQKDHEGDLDGTAKDLAKFRTEYAKVRAAWRTNLTKRGGLHWWVDIWGVAAQASHYATAKIVAFAIPLSYAAGIGSGIGLLKLVQWLGAY